MIDPDGIQVQSLNLPANINIKKVPEFETECWCLEDDKEYEKFVKEVEKQVRRSFEYRKFIAYLRENMQMNQCAFLKGVTNEESFNIKIEIHHYPFSLRDIVEIVIRKRGYYNESMSVQMVSKEVMQLHYKLLVGLIPLSETVHELAHNSRIFVPSDKVIGRYNVFVEYYKPFCDPDQLETLERIEKYSEEKQNVILNTNILSQNKLTYNIEDSKYLLPEPEKITNNMIEQMKNIKANNYVLPTVDDKIMLEKKKDIKTAVRFDENLKNNSGKYSWE